MAVNTASLVIVLPEMASTPAEEPASVSERARLSAAFPPSSGVSPYASMATLVTLPPVMVTVTDTSLRQPFALAV